MWVALWWPCGTSGSGSGSESESESESESCIPSTVPVRRSHRQAPSDQARVVLMRAPKLLHRIRRTIASVAAFVYDPERVARVLRALPALAALLPDPRAEGRRSKVFDGMRLTDRALYRLLANPHYPHLREALRGIGAAAAAGLKLRELRTANLRGEFGSYLQEALLADHFLSRGLAVSKGHAKGRNPDLEVVAGDFSLTIEVYSPRSWQWRKDWLADVVDTVKYADIPYAYSASVDVVVEGIPLDAELLEKIILDTGREVLTQITNDLAHLEETSAGSTWSYDHAGREIRTTIKFGRVDEHELGLDRWVSLTPPSEIYGAEPEFDEVLRKIREKAEKRQADGGSGALRGLSVDVSRTGIDYELETGRIKFTPMAAARAGIDLDQLSLDFVALTVPRRGKDGPKRGVRAAVLFEDTRITNAQLQQLYDFV
jgi:hypothetical protein